METRAEITNLLGALKAHLAFHRDLGLDPPPISSKRPKIKAPAVHGSLKTEADLTHLDSLESLRRHIGDCKRCQLHQSRNRLVFGEGSPSARLVFVGEAPGQEENREGRPFVGESGRLLTRIIENGMGLKRGDIYLCNIVKCHPPRNRDPEADEMTTCLPFLKRQLAIIRPEVICTLGLVALRGLLGKPLTMKSDRGTWHTYEGIPLMPTYHPAYLLRNASAKRQVWDDIKKVMARLGLEVSKK